LAEKKWYRKVSSNKTLSIGGQVYYLPKAVKNTKLTVSFDLQNTHLIFRDDKELVASLPIKALDFEAIAGLNFTNQSHGRPRKKQAITNSTRLESV
jgi:hypothetical protein